MSGEGTAPLRVMVLGAEWVGDRPGGMNRYLADLSAALTQRGLSVRTLVLGPCTDAPPEVLPVSSRHAGLATRMSAMARAARDGAAAGAQVLDTHFALYAFLALRHRAVRSLPHVVHFQGPWAQESVVARGRRPLATALKRRLERVVYRHADVAVVLCEPFAAVLAEQYGVPRERIVVLAPGVDLERFSPGDRATARERLGVPPGDFLVVAARRLDPRMGLDVLVTAWASVLQAHPGARLLIAGEGAERARLEELIARLPRPDSVALLGRVSDELLRDLYRAADCSVVPTLSLEGFGLVTVESLACGTPAVVTDVGGLPQGVVGLDPSLVVPSGDPCALADRLVQAAAGRLPSRDSCRQHAESFAWSEVAARHEEVYRAAVQRCASRTGARP